jgi:hypothetical protein
MRIHRELAIQDATNAVVNVLEIRSGHDERLIAQQVLADHNFGQDDEAVNEVLTRAREAFTPNVRFGTDRD